MEANAHLGIVDLLGLVGFDTSRRIKMVRHQESKYDIADFLRRGWLDAYQGFQGKPVFDKTEIIVSFIGVGRTHARLVGVYEVLQRKPGAAGLLPPGCPHVEWLSLPHFYEMQRLTGFDELEHRVIIDWGKATRSWHQRLTNKEVLQVLPKGQLLKPFDDYLGFTLTFSELRYLFAVPGANSEWRSRLSAVGGAYLILASTTGAQYVGSAYGPKGFWGRWSAYAQNGHGGNVLLRNLIASDSAYPGAFTYSILQILPSTATRSDVLNWEMLYKAKLGSRAVGLNAN